jgi:dolichol-phosphate mannosyltransferase
MNKKDDHTISISIVSAIYNEASSVSSLLDDIQKTLRSKSLSYEIIIVDDGSDDETLNTLKMHLNFIAHLKVVELERNVGQVNALSAGMTVAEGEWIVMMDGDLQHDPKDILRFLEYRNKGCDLIASYRIKRDESFRRKLITWIGNYVNRFLIGANIKDFGSAYRMMHTSLINCLKDSNGNVYYNTPKLYTLSRKYVQLPITQYKRPHGTTKWNLRMFVAYNMDFITASQRIAVLLIFASMFGVVTGFVLYFLKIFGIFKDVQAVSAPASILLSSFTLSMIAVIWREVIVSQELIKGVPSFIIKKIWAAPPKS